MSYTIMFVTEGQVQRCLSWDADLEPAKDYARDQLPPSSCEHVEIWDDERIVFKCGVPLQAGGDCTI